MNDTLNKLAVLFAKRGDIDKQILELLASPIVELMGSPVEETEEPIQKKYKKKKKPGKYNKANPMPEEVKEQIRAKRSEGVAQIDLAKEFGVSSSTIMKVLKTQPDRLTTKNKQAQNYVCVNGHEFLSKLPLIDVTCPTCHSLDCDLGTLNGPVAEDEA